LRKYFCNQELVFPPLSIKIIPFPTIQKVTDKKTALLYSMYGMYLVQGAPEQLEPSKLLRAAAEAAGGGQPGCSGSEGGDRHRMRLPVSSGEEYTCTGHIKKHFLFVYFFGGLESMCWPLCICRPFMIFEGCLNSNSESAVASGRAINLTTHLLPSQTN
jgi:hypothetical protein